MSKVHEKDCMQKTSEHNAEDGMPAALPTMSKGESKISAGTVAPAN